MLATSVAPMIHISSFQSISTKQYDIEFAIQVVHLSFSNAKEDIFYHDDNV
jgi:hypothetical protein